MQLSFGTVYGLTEILLGLKVPPRPAQCASAVRRDWTRISFSPTFHIYRGVDYDSPHAILAKYFQQALQDPLPQGLYFPQRPIDNHKTSLADAIKARLLSGQSSLHISTSRAIP
jgi:hypothetical protein